MYGSFCSVVHQSEKMPFFSRSSSFEATGAGSLATSLEADYGTYKTWVVGSAFDISIIENADVDGEKQVYCEVLSTNGDTFLDWAREKRTLDTHVLHVRPRFTT